MAIYKRILKKLVPKGLLTEVDAAVLQEEFESKNKAQFEDTKQLHEPLEMPPN